jgi:excinuclease ABC subunit A
VIVVEHDADTIRAADHILEIGPGPGVHGGKVVAEGPLKKFLKDDNSLTGSYLSGKKSIGIPGKRRPASGKSIVVRGARQNNLKNSRQIPLEQFVCITAARVGKSSLIHEIVQKRLYSIYDSRVRRRARRTPASTSRRDRYRSIAHRPLVRSNPATYIGFYGSARCSPRPIKPNRGCTASTFSFNAKGGRCEECTGEGRSPLSFPSCPTSRSPAHVQRRDTTKTHSGKYRQEHRRGSIVR